MSTLLFQLISHHFATVCHWRRLASAPVDAVDTAKKVVAVIMMNLRR